MEEAIAITHLTKLFYANNQPFTAVNNLSFSVPQGQVFGFLGPNGAGKTTTIKMICGLITPTSGSITINGYDPNKQRAAAMRSIGAVLEGNRNIYWQLSSWENLLYFGKLKGAYGEPLYTSAKRLLQELSLWGKKDVPVGSFSRGMQQKVAIACALVADPAVILLDEPTLGLDLQTARVIKEWILHLAEQRKKTIVLTTHQLDVAQELCERIAIIKQGAIIADKPLAELLSLLGSDYYVIKIKSTAQEYANLFQEMPNLTITTTNYAIKLSFPIDDEETLHRCIQIISHHKLPLSSIKKKKSSLEDIFLHLTQKDSTERNNR